MIGVFTPYEWPEGLYPLRDWMRRKGVDVDNLKSERQATFMAKELSSQKIKLPNDRRTSLFPVLLKLQKTLCPQSRKAMRTEQAARKGPYVSGTFGAASEVRHIDPSEYEVKS